MNRTLLAASVALALAACQQAPGGRCEADADCTAGQHCSNGLCLSDLRQAPVGQSCYVDKDCVAWADCVQNECLLSPGACDTTPDCQPWQACNVAHACETVPGGCGNEADCAAWQNCDTSAWRCVSAPGFCGGEAECAAWQDCGADHRCATAAGFCAADPDCGSWQSCDPGSHLCASLPGSCGSEGECETWQDCGTDHVCATASGFCATEDDCETWQDCGADHLCATAAGFCAAAADCEAWQACGSDHLCATASGYCDAPADCLADETCSPTTHVCAALGIADQVSVGWAHMCVLKAGVVRCWGNGVNGELGTGELVTESAPRRIASASAFVSVVCENKAHCCGVTDAGAVECWGGGVAGRIGNQPTPTQMISSGAVRVYILMSTAVAIMEDGRILGWGDNYWGALPSGVTLLPAEVFTPGEYVALTSETFYGIGWGITAAGAAQRWHGDGSPFPYAGIPAPVAKLSTGYDVVYALTTTGEVYRIPVSGGPNPPVLVAGLPPGIVDLDAGTDHACVLTAERRPMCWGANGWGTLGDGTTTGSTTPVETAWGLGPAAAISAGESATCALLEGGALYCWGLTRLYDSETETYLDSVHHTPFRMTW